MGSSKYRESFVVRVSAMCLVLDKVWHKGEGGNVLIIIDYDLEILQNLGSLLTKNIFSL